METCITESELEPSFFRKRRLMLVTYMVRMFLMGVEYSVILPSAWLYLETFDVVGTWFMGLVVSAYPLAAMIVLPIVGRIYDRTLRGTEILLALNAFLIVGNIVYAIPYSQWFPLLGRFIAGFGDSFTACAVGEFTHIYQAKHRTEMLAILELGRVLGLILGPSLNFFIAKTSFSLWGWTINYATMPGVLMALAWIVMQFLTYLGTFNLARQIVQHHNYRALPKNDAHAEASMTEQTNVSERDVLVPNDSSGRFKHGNSNLARSAFESEVVSGNSYRLSSTWSILSQLLTVEFMVLFYVDLVLWLSQTEFEILLPLVTESEYGWSQEQVGLVYVVGGFELLIVFGIVYAIAHKQIRDIYMLITSLLFTFVAMNLMILESYLKNLFHRMVVFCTICALVFGSIPLNLVSAKALISKMTAAEDQGLIQGFFSAVSRVALVAGPILGSLSFYNRRVYGIVSSCCCLVGLVAMGACSKSFYTREAEMRKKHGTG